MTVRATLILATLAGLLAGVIIALAVPQTRPAPSLAASPAAGAAPAVTTVRRVAAPRAAPSGPGWVRLRAVGPMSVEARVPDVGGGPDWAVRSFLAERLADTKDRLGLHVIGHNRCFQLGRLHDGRFGWLTTDGTFRPARVSLTGVPTRCVSRRADLRDGAFAELRFLVTDPRRPAARVLDGVVWGAADPAAHPALQVRGHTGALRIGTHGGLLATVARDVRAADVRVTAAARTLLPFERHFGPIGGSAGTPKLAAEAPDPDGGLPWALLVSRDGDTVCTMSGPRVVEDRAGSVDYALDTFSEDGAGGGGCGKPPGAKLPNGRTLPPWTLSSSMGGVAREPGADPAVGRIARRTEPGRVTIAGAAEPDVASLTIESPADVRTVVPTGEDHGFIVVYAGEFTTGDFVITTHFKDGRTRRDRVPAAL